MNYEGCTTHQIRLFFMDSEKSESWYAIGLQNKLGVTLGVTFHFRKHKLLCCNACR